MPSIYDPIPNSPFYSAPSYSVDSGLGPLILGSGLTVTPSGTLLVTSALGGTVTQINTGVGLAGGPINTTGTINLVPATVGTLGGIKVGANLIISADGTLSALPPGIGTVSAVVAGVGLSGGGSSGTVTLNLNAASTSQFGGVSISPTGGINVSSGSLSLAAATTTQRGGIELASIPDVIAGVDNTKAVTPSGLASKTATTTRLGIVQLSDSVATNDSTKAATQTAAKLAYDSALAAQTTANAALPKAGGTMTGVITFAPSQTFPGVAFPVATASSLGVVQIGSGLTISVGGILSTSNNGTVTSVVAGPGLGAPATGNPITTTGVIRLLPPTVDGLSLGGVRKGTNIVIGADGTISTENLLQTNNPYAYNSYIWPAPNAPGPGPIPALPCPGLIGQVLTVADNVTGQLAWTSTGTLSSIVAGAGLQVSSTPTTATVSLAVQPSVVPGNFGGTALIPTLAINQYGQVTSTGIANPYSPFQTATVTAPPILVLDFAYNNLNWEWVLQGNTTIQDPLNAQSGQTGHLLIEQNAFSPYSLTWGAAWKFANFTPYLGNSTLAARDLIQFTVVAPNYIVVTNIIQNLG